MLIKTNDMINNTVSVAQYKLEEHLKKGVNSELSIFEAARLMDMIHFGTKQDVEKDLKPIFFSFSVN